MADSYLVHAEIEFGKREVETAASYQLVQMCEKKAHDAETCKDFFEDMLVKLRRQKAVPGQEDKVHDGIDAMMEVAQFHYAEAERVRVLVQHRVDDPESLELEIVDVNDLYRDFLAVETCNGAKARWFELSQVARHPLSMFAATMLAGEPAREQPREGRQATRARRTQREREEQARLIRNALFHEVQEPAAERPEPDRAVYPDPE